MANNIIKRTWKQGGMVGIEDLRGLTFQNEALAHTFKISGVDADGSAIVLTGTPAGVMLRADNMDVALTCALSDGCVTASLPAECYDVPGRAEITIYLTEDGHKVCIYAAIVSVNRTSSGTASPGTAADVVDLVNLMQTSVDAAADSATAAAGSATSAAASAETASAAYNVNLLAPNFVQENPYPAGQHVINDGGYYVLPNGHEADVTWANTSKTQLTVGGELTDLKSALSDNKIAVKALSKEDIDLVDSGLIEYDKASGTNIINTSSKAGIAVIKNIPHNLFIPKVESGYISNVAYSYEGDGVYSFTGTANADGFLKVYTQKLPVGKYSLYGDIDQTKFSLYVANVKNGPKYGTANGITFEVVDESLFVNISIVVKNTVAYSSDTITVNLTKSDGRVYPVVPFGDYEILIDDSDGNTESRTASVELDTLVVPTYDGYTKIYTSEGVLLNAHFLVNPSAEIVGHALEYLIQWISGKYVNPANGQFETDAGYRRTDYIEIDADAINITVYGEATNLCGFYKSDKTFIYSFGLIVGDNKIKIPDDAKYFVVSGKISNGFDVSAYPVIQQTSDNHAGLEQLSKTADGISFNITDEMISIVGSEVEFNDSVSGFALVCNLPHNLFTPCYVKGKVATNVNYEYKGNNSYTLNGTAASTSSFVAFKAYLPVGEYSIKGAESGKVTFKLNNVRNGPRYDAGTGNQFGVNDMSNPVIVEVYVSNGVTYSNYSFNIEITRTDTGIIQPKAPAGDYYVYSEDSSGNVIKTLVKPYMRSVAVPSFEGYTKIYADNSVILSANFKKKQYYLIDSFNKPLNFTGKSFVAIGDSIMLGYWSQHTYIEKCFMQKFKEKAGLGDWRQAAIGGATWSDYSETGTVIGELQSITLSNYDYIFIHCGTNDYTMGVTRSDFMDALDEVSTYIEANKKDGANVVILTPVGRTWPANVFELPLDAYREMITTWALKNQYTLLNGKNLGIPDIDSAYAQSVLVDGIHPGELGHNVIANAMTKLL